MAGVVAMASVIEDFDSQPCKKSRKDGGSPVVKPITNYFSPVPKPVKPFSPPRSNNIMDYFSRKAPPTKEKTSLPQQSKENREKSRSAEKPTGSETRKRPSEKQRKTCRAAKKLVVTETVSSSDEASCVIVEETEENQKSPADSVSTYRILGSDTAALLSKLSAETCNSDISDITDAKSVGDEQNESGSPPESGSKSENNVKQETVPNTTELSPTVPSRVETKRVKKAAQNARKRQQKEAKCPEPEERGAEGSLCDDGMEVNMAEASQLNSSTVTISFEDFVRSQNKMEEDVKDDKDNKGKSSTEAEESNPEHLDVPKSEDDTSPVVPSVQISPRTVTIQAEVHAVSAKQEAVKAAGKVASIFKRRKGSNSPAEIVSSPHTKDEHQSPALSPSVKRKSNVVLQEDDLELAVIESESTPKCSEAERKQFMAAFKQPSLDGNKTKPVKSQGKQKQAEEKTVEAADQTTEDSVVIVLSDNQISQNNTPTKKKPAKSGRSKAKVEKEAVTASPAATAVDKTEDKEEGPPVTSSPSGLALRRSRREAVRRQSPETPAASPVRKTRRQKETKEAAAVVSLEDSPRNMSTPKTRRSKYGVFVAEMVCPQNVKESPIRIKFSRIHRNSTSKTESGGDKKSLTSKTSNESKKRKQAKKLVEKAKMIQQSKKTCVEKETPRRSSRVKTSIQRSYCYDEDSLICVDDLSSPPQAAPEKSKTQKPLRSLNDVLGKASPADKESKLVPGSRVASLSQERSCRRVSAVVSIFDESSREGSETSQDDEQFRARREFLKSGLPESFRKQMAKTAATKEAYSIASSSFQTVTHTKQPPDDCPLWSLPWPESSLLSHLKETWSQTLNRLPSVSSSLCVKTVPACRKVYEKASGWRPEFSESIRQLLVEELGISNSHFPTQTFFARFLERRAEHQRQFTPSVPEEKPCPPLPAESVGGKRKRSEDGRGGVMKVAKKQKSNHSVEGISKAEQEPPKRRRRGLRSRVKEEEEEEVKEKLKPSPTSAPVPSEDDSVVVVDDLILEEDAGKKDVVKEDLLWTDKYQPQHCSDIVDNTAAVKRLHSWLKEWKLRADREERRNQKDKKQEEGSNDSDWDCRDEDSQDTEDTEDMLCNTVLITGPTGVGKTAAVYACAQELGFKVFEVNASSQRSGRLILSQLREATQSHQVDSQGVNAYKPTYFNSYGASSSVKPGLSPRKLNSPRKVVSSPRKVPQSQRSAKKGGLAPTSLAKFFKVANKEPPKTTKKEEKAASKKAIKGDESGAKTKDGAVKSPAVCGTKEQNRTATSLILFEEVDVIFEDDSGFLAAIKTFMSTTKRPVILTTSDPAFGTTFDGSFEEIHFKTLSPLNVGSYLQLLCLAEDVRTDPSDVGALLRLNGCDVRQSLLQLQFWTRSAGGRRSLHTGQNADLKPDTEEASDNSAILPPRDTGCTESKLGLPNAEPDRDVWELLRSQSLMEDGVCWDLLTDSRRRGVDLLYSNMETLLPLPLTQLTTSKLSQAERRVSSSPNKQSVGPTQQPSDMLPESSDCSDDGSPVKVSNRMRKSKRQRRLPDRDGLQSESDSDDGFLSLCKPLSDPQKEKVGASVVCETIKRKLLTEEERRKSLPVSQCLESLADFWDSMSCLDSSLPFHPGFHRGTPWVGAVIKDGMSDELRVETGGGSGLTGGRVLEIQAAVEALSFHKCRDSVTEAWEKAQQLEGELGKEAAAELTLPVAAHRQAYSFTQDALCHPQLAQRRKEAMENLASRAFGTLGNRRALALDYLPTMRTICRSEQLKERGKVKRRFLHYLDAIHLGLEKNTLQLLAEDFP
ncbi:ATPase family AAA domain-containing protein 5 isoform X2 [Kryptolebias marmoratus]|uniref:ATPase family AAA domain-containing protein 5 isoform X2 n=1 Tax=Kryptolebias marmoratus TaxID=37003 RepID=UPI0007F8D33E|nr:ATPase family AAA domain-containing protein 5 isoform X2 [Kryptolebias marmoratus]